MVEIKREVVKTVSSWADWRVWELSGLPCGAQVRVEQRKFDGGLLVRVKDPAPFAEVWEEGFDKEKNHRPGNCRNLEFFMYAEPEVMAALAEVMKEAGQWEAVKAREEE